MSRKYGITLTAAFVQFQGQFINLPEVPPGVFNVSTRLELRTTTTAVWDALTNFPAYADWNPFVRSATLSNQLNSAAYPVEGANLYMRVQIPPLPLPVDASTPDNPLHTQITLENITHVQPERLRLAWKHVLPDAVLDAERWQGISDLGNGKVLYESREVYRGAGAIAIKALFAEGLQQAFDAQGAGLKLLLEG
ncbi:uncharacterized protein EI97DRAFT_450658 [Westerdykella ornata]|uniref:Coenzyme Q-binding protein COQ10 START domain-containing protein n=1 Tax=Westerdykella ornata TaxID=318751 RepID=A0A6A6JHI0_WESOR|nr:uncharacterized protein EI97DRAFT_450658 [Westerdykella ornata]KAF2275837.1 hypothetical protein EI97DRAFT_450658 [Westerdykella ornata]